MTKENKQVMIWGLAALGHAAGIIVAVKRKSGFWGGVGWFIVGGMVGGGLGYVITAMTNSGQASASGTSPITNDQVNKLMNAAAGSGADTFEGMTMADIRSRWLKNLSSADVDRLTVLFSKSESDSSPAELSELATLLAKGAGVSVSSLQG